MDNLPLDLSDDNLRLTLHLAAGDKEAFKHMYMQCSGDIFRYVCSFTRDPSIAEDLTQETFSRVWHSRAALMPEQPWRPYVFTIARNLVLHYLRHQRVIATVDQALLNESTASTVPGMARSIVSPEAEMVQREDLQRLEAAISCLPHRMQEAFRLRWQSELSYREIAQTLEISERTVENQLARALFLVRQTMLLENND